MSNTYHIIKRIRKQKPENKIIVDLYLNGIQTDYDCLKNDDKLNAILHYLYNTNRSMHYYCTGDELIRINAYFYIIEE